MVARTIHRIDDCNPAPANRSDADPTVCFDRQAVEHDVPLRRGDDLPRRRSIIGKQTGCDDLRTP